MTSYELEQRPTDDPSLVRVDVSGELDLTNAHEVEERLEAITAANGSRLVLDLNRVVFIDSAALHVLFRTARRLGEDRFALSAGADRRGRADARHRRHLRGRHALGVAGRSSPARHALLGALRFLPRWRRVSPRRPVAREAGIQQRKE